MSEKIIIIPDSFKGSMTSETVADILGEVIEAKTSYEAVKIPIADGGEGSTHCILKSLGGERRRVQVHSPQNEIIEAMYGVTPDKTAVIEIAESSGITRQSKLGAMTATTYGFGELIKAALDEGIRKFLLCLGGSATTDCGCGMAAALGVRFFDNSGSEFVPDGGTLLFAERIDMSGLDERISESAITVMTDVENPLFGSQGAAYIYGPQKGASEDDVVILDEGLRHMSLLMEKAGLISPDSIKGAGAAGGAGYGCAAFLGAKLVSGIEAMLDICHFDELVKDAEYVVTGEGKLDAQSLMGKVICGIRNHSLGKKVVVFCGISELDEKTMTQEGISCVEIGRGIPITESIENGEKYIRLKATEYFEKENTHE